MTNIPHYETCLSEVQKPGLLAACFTSPSGQRALDPSPLDAELDNMLEQGRLGDENAIARTRIEAIKQFCLVADHVGDSVAPRDLAHIFDAWYSGHKDFCSCTAPCSCKGIRLEKKEEFVLKVRLDGDGAPLQCYREKCRRVDTAVTSNVSSTRSRGEQCLADGSLYFARNIREVLITTDEPHRADNSSRIAPC